MLQTWDASGRQTLQLDSRLAKFMGVASIGWDTTGAAQSGTISDSRFSQYAGCQPFAAIISGQIDIGGYMPQISISGNTLTWTYPRPAAAANTRPNTVFLYGIF